MNLAVNDLSLIQPDTVYAASCLEARREGYTDTSLPLPDQAQLGPEQLAEHLATLNQHERGVR